MGRFRRRKRKYTWFPQIGFQSDNAEDDSVTLPLAIPNVNLDGTLSDVNIFPIVPDAPNDRAATVADHLEDFIGSEYFLKRIVGRVCIPSAVYLTVPAVFCVSFVVGVGFFVARAADDTTGFQNAIGTATQTERKANYGPLVAQNTREPWIWRRTWTLSPIYTDANGFQIRPQAGGLFPNNNMHGSVAEGSHIDARTARRVGNDERLWCAVQTAVMATQGNVTNEELQLQGGSLDVRILGALRRAKNRSAF